MEIHTGDVVCLRKKHPCGGDQWQVASLGIDVKIVCLTCQRRVLLERSVFERRIRSLLSKDELKKEGQI
jgi:hypothetical protein